MSAGVLVVAIAIPLSMGMAEVAGVPPVAGLYTCVLPLVAYACIGASRHLVIGLDASTAAMLAAAVAPLAAGDAGRYLALAGALTVLVGVVLVVAGSLRLGGLTALLSNPGLLGYQAGLGVIVIINQFPRLLGVPVTETEPLPRAAELAGKLGQISGWTVGVAVVTVGLVVTMRVVRPTAPGALVAVVAVTAATGLTGLADRGVALVGDIPAGLPRLGLPDVSVSDIRALVLAAASIALVAAADTIATARAFAVRNGYPLDPNRELMALGAANVASGVSGGITASASAARTAVAEAAGGRTPLASAVAGATLAVVLLFFTGVLEAVPVVALAAVVVVAVARIIDLPAIVQLGRVRPAEAGIAVITMGTVVAVGTLEGIVAAIVLSLADVARRMAVARSDRSAPLPEAPGAALRIGGPLFFANAERFACDVTKQAEQRDATEVVVDASRVTDIDMSAAATLAGLSERLDQQGRSLRLVGASPGVARLLHGYALDHLLAPSMPPLSLSGPVPAGSRHQGASP